MVQSAIGAGLTKTRARFCHCERASPTCVKRKAGRARRGNPVNKKVSAMPTAI